MDIHDSRSLEEVMESNALEMDKAISGREVAIKELKDLILKLRYENTDALRELNQTKSLNIFLLLGLGLSLIWIITCMFTHVNY